MINTLFIIDDVTFTEEQDAQFAQLTAQWHVINNNGTRQLIEAIISPDKFAEAETALATWNPNIIGKWNKDGSVIELNDTTEYIALLPPITTVNPDETITETPRTEAVMIHKFAGWGDKSWVAPVPPPVEVI